MRFLVVVFGVEPNSVGYKPTALTAVLHDHIWWSQQELNLHIPCKGLAVISSWLYQFSYATILEQKMGVEPTTFSLQVRYTANCVTPANLYLLYHVYCLLSSGFDNSNITMFRPSSYIIITPQYSINEKISLSLQTVIYKLLTLNTEHLSRYAELYRTF